MIYILPIGCDFLQPFEPSTCGGLTQEVEGGGQIPQGEVVNCGEVGPMMRGVNSKDRGV